MKELTGGWGVDVVAELVGFPQAIPEGLEMLASAGLSGPAREGGHAAVRAAGPESCYNAGRCRHWRAVRRAPRVLRRAR